MGDDRIDRDLIGTVKEIVMNKNGKELYPVQMENVVVSSESNYNLYSITGKSEQFMIIKGYMRVNFDIKIKPPQEMFFLLAIERDKSQNEVTMLGITKWTKVDSKAQNFKVSALPGSE